jgi:hypothetical protein
MKTTDFPLKLRVASPCRAKWEDMNGDERVRFCSLCKKNVYNLSSMTTDQVATLIQEKEGKLCGRFYQRKDGTLLTADCPVGLAHYWKKARAIAVTVSAALLLTVVNIAALSRPDNGSKQRSRLVDNMEDAKWQVKQWLGLNRPILVGEAIACPPPVMGKVSPSSTNLPTSPKTETK